MVHLFRHRYQAEKLPVCVKCQSMLQLTFHIYVDLGIVWITLVAQLTMTVQREQSELLSIYQAYSLYLNSKQIIMTHTTLTVKALFSKPLWHNSNTNGHGACVCGWIQFLGDVGKRAIKLA